jgi:hypothetical protein
MSDPFSNWTGPSTMTAWQLHDRSDDQVREGGVLNGSTTNQYGIEVCCTAQAST